MPLTLGYRPSFERSLKNLGSVQIQTVALIMKCLEAYHGSDCDLQTAQEIAPGFFYKQLRRPYFEAGVESRLRVLLAREASACVAIIAGNHDQIRTLLKRF